MAGREANSFPGQSVFRSDPCQWAIKSKKLSLDQCLNGRTVFGYWCPFSGNVFPPSISSALVCHSCCFCCFLSTWQIWALGVSPFLQEPGELPARGHAEGGADPLRGAQQDKGHELEGGKFPLGIRNKLFTRRMVKHRELAAQRGISPVGGAQGLTGHGPEQAHLIRCVLD